MSSANPKDFLSTFYDREATPEEEAAAKSQVERSPEARREVQEYARLSRLIQDVPRVVAPPEFAAVVMQRAERESLIPLDPIAPAAANVQPSRRTWALAASAIVSVAAALLIAVNIFKPPAVRNAPQEVAKQDISQEASAGKMSTIVHSKLDDNRKEAFGRADVVAKRTTALGATVAKSIDRRSAASSAKGGALAGAPVSAPGQAASSSTAATYGMRLASPSKDATGPNNVGQNNAGQNAMGEQLGSQLLLPANLKTAKVGQVVEALQQDGEQVAVVRLTVVNQMEGLDGIQSVLMQNTKRDLQNVDEIKRTRQQFVADKEATVSKLARPTAPGDTICVYVEGSREEMLRVLQGLQDEIHIQKAELTNTIEFTALEKFAGRAVPANRQMKERETVKEPVANGGFFAQVPSSPGSQLAVSLPPSTVNQIFSARRPSTSAAKQAQSPASGLVVQNSPAPPSAASQKRESQPRQDGVNSRSQTQTADKAALIGGSSRNEVPKIAKQDERAKLRDSKEVAGNQKSFQFFFVITDQSAAPAAQPAPAAAKPVAPTWGRRPAGQVAPSAKVPAKAAAPNQTR
ncbi:MAG TPA: hypothetical protein VFG04_13695 [Planctomycetaceae bacterium]|jgi:hypothetical protein|nr:hypothetical protein [Planctomycetaceae bacterium]